MDSKKILQPLMLEWQDQRFPNFFERDPDLSLVNNSRLSSFFNISHLLFSHVHTIPTDRGGARGVPGGATSPQNFA